MIYSAIVFLTLLVLFLTSAASVAQDSDEEPGQAGETPVWIQPANDAPDTDFDWVSPDSGGDEQPHLEDQVVTTLRSQAFSVDRESKIGSLRVLTRIHASGALNPRDEDTVRIVAFLATESYDFAVMQGGRTINDFPLVRAEAVRLLGSIGGQQALAALHRVLLHEPDSYVLSEAVRAVGQSADRPTPELVTTLTGLADRMNHSLQPDNALAMSIIGAVDRLQSLGLPIDDPELFRALIEMTQGGYSLTVRRSALALVNRLRRREQ